MSTSSPSAAGKDPGVKVPGPPSGTVVPTPVSPKSPTPVRPASSKESASCWYPSTSTSIFFSISSFGVVAKAVIAFPRALSKSCPLIAFVIVFAITSIVPVEKPPVSPMVFAISLPSLSIASSKPIAPNTMSFVVAPDPIPLIVLTNSLGGASPNMFGKSLIMLFVKIVKPPKPAKA